MYSALNINKVRKNPGIARLVREQRHAAIYARIDPDLLRAAELPPNHVQSQLEEIMGPERMRDLKLRLHPLWMRWTLFEREKRPEGETWAPISVFMEPAKEDYLPQDLQKEDLRHLTGIIGDYRLPARKDFEILERTDVKKYGYRSVENYLAEPEKEHQRDGERQFEDQAHDFLSYHQWLAKQEFLGGRPWSVPTVELFSDTSRWVTIEKEGYKIRVKRFSPAHYSLVNEEEKAELEMEGKAAEAYRAYLASVRAKKSMERGEGVAAFEDSVIPSAESGNKPRKLPQYQGVLQ